MFANIFSKDTWRFYGIFECFITVYFTCVGPYIIAFINKQLIIGSSTDVRRFFSQVLLSIHLYWTLLIEFTIDIDRFLSFLSS